MCKDSYSHPPKDVKELNEDKEKQKPRKLETLITSYNSNYKESASWKVAS